MVKLLDKIKNLFMDDVDETEDVDVEVDHESEIQYKETPNVLPKVMRDTIMREEKKEFPSRENRERPVSQPSKEFSLKDELELPKQESKPKFDFSMDFAEDLVQRSANKNVLTEEIKERKEVREIKKPQVELYPEKENKEKPKFKPTPVISPVYGVLDKNYTKEEVKEKAEDTVDMKRPSKKVDFETVRKKAFGNISDDIKDNLMCENCELYKEAIKNKLNDNVLYETLKEDEPKVEEDIPVEEVKEEITIEKAYDNYEDYGVSYETPKRSKNEDVLIQDNSNNDATGEEIEFKEKVEDTEILSSDEIEDKIDFTRIKESIKSYEEPEVEEVKEEKKDAKVDEDFFELIDSMYKDRSEE